MRAVSTGNLTRSARHRQRHSKSKRGTLELRWRGCCWFHSRGTIGSIARWPATSKCTLQAYTHIHTLTYIHSLIAFRRLQQHTDPGLLVAALSCCSHWSYHHHHHRHHHTDHLKSSRRRWQWKDQVAAAAATIAVQYMTREQTILGYMKAPKREYRSHLLPNSGVLATLDSLPVRACVCSHLPELTVQSSRLLLHCSLVFS